MQQVPVVIVGAGPVGLSMSILLSRFGIRNLVVEKRGGVSTLPRARGIMSRTMEIWRHFGLAEEMDALSLPPDWCGKFVYLDTLAGEAIGDMPSGVMVPGACAQWTAMDFKCLAQDHIDAILWRHAKTYPNGDIRFRTEVHAYSQDDDGVTLTLRSGVDGHVTETLRTQWLIGADGSNSTIRKLAGIERVGRENLQAFVNCHFHADLSRWTKGREGALIYTLGKGAEGVFQALDGERRWMCQLWLDPQKDSMDGWTEERVLARVRAMIGAPEAEQIDFDLHSNYSYTLAAVVAERLRDRRVLLVGDAAHHVPPFGGIGLNSGLQTAHNLAWKLAAVMRGAADMPLLDTFDSERREVARRVIAYCMDNLHYVLDIRRAATREAQRAAVAASRPYGNWAGLDLGVHYEAPGAFIDDGTPLPATAHAVIDYVPSAKPGYRAPHFWVEQGERRFSVVELFEQDFVLLAGERGHSWIEAAAGLRGIGKAPIPAWRVGSNADLKPDRSFTGLYGVQDDGAVLVRPDGHVAFRSPVALADPRDTLKRALQAVLSGATQGEAQ
ncbi:FAD-dependent monooxygenase [Paraburkholderia ginsengiterrae]|uniref:FAD-dependent monooxygenase n=1 Tax=Paraburkholderia ginsengiterrae TaxID=1462993 RepID=UPI00094F6506|nr:FAD-dependent monooxygenase [Paraburkholderia ginsengiterrae]